MVAHLQVKLCARLGTNLLDLTTDVRSLVKDLLPKPIKKSAQDTSSETPPVPDPASNKSVVEGTVSIQHVLFEINGKTYQNLNQCKPFHLPVCCNFIRKLVIYYCKLSEWVCQFQFLLPKLSISDRFLWVCTSPHILVQHIWGLCNVWCLPLTPLHQSYLYDFQMSCWQILRRHVTTNQGGQLPARTWNTTATTRTGSGCPSGSSGPSPN